MLKVSDISTSRSARTMVRTIPDAAARIPKPWMGLSRSRKMIQASAMEAMGCAPLTREAFVAVVKLTARSVNPVAMPTKAPSPRMIQRAAQISAAFFTIRFATNGSSTSAPINHRQKVRVIGPASSKTARPITMLAAQEAAVRVTKI